MTGVALNVNPSADVRFGGTWRGVITTGIYCRLSCGSRVPRPENLRFRKGRRACGFPPLPPLPAE
ncbi:hypothetical protein N7E02_00620 (plasmid) [Aliirhizobium terrae]|uniref:Ada metal-binding domain-containing protein n=1 Tax=Terrirhizobium terrae TaxID=2926709 RepID=UPI002577F09F|nr:Ada metal-binding domain-containing protein [Rhizobium sp. CC-CFT758]WJH37969.1 hypothetical protein N7E02_00620 [Rhizobium sp. CC-CFT758]